MTYDELVEKVARSLAVVAWEKAVKTDRCFILHASPHKTPTAYEDGRWELYKDEAEATIATIREVLNIDTEEMINAAEMYSYQGYPGTKGYGGLWRAMLAASPLGEKKG